MVAAIINSSVAQNLLTGKSVYTLGEAKTWTSSDDATYTFVTADLNKLVAEPENTSNIYLFPEAGGGWATDANKETGIQGFYIDMETTQEISIITTTWEGAAANAYDIYLTDTEPTLDILNTTPTCSDSGLGQYTHNTAQLPAGSTGRYLVFQPTDATNWGWGVKIRSIAAMAPAEDVLTSFNVMPGFVILNQATALTMTFTNQNGLDIDPSKVNVTVSDNATLTGTELIISSGTKAVLTATLKKVSLTANVFVATPPAIPESESIMTPIYTNTVTEYNDKAGFMVGYNGGAKDNGEIVFPDGEVARSFADTRCIFFYNTQTTGGWNGNIHPAENGYGSLHLEIFGSKDVMGCVEFEGAQDIDGNNIDHTHYFTLTPGEWTIIDINLVGVSKLNNMSLRFSADNMCDILLANVYFASPAADVDEISHLGLDPATVKNQETTVVTVKAITKGEIEGTINEVTDLKLSCSDPEAVEITIGNEAGTFNVTGLKEGTFTLTATGMVGDTTIEGNAELTVTHNWTIDNIAFGKSISGRLTDDVAADYAYLPSYANDGDDTTYYRYDGAWTETWVIVDLGDEYVISDINIAYGATSSGTYVISFGLDDAEMPAADQKWTGNELQGWTSTDHITRTTSIVNYYNLEHPVVSRYVAIRDISNPNGNPRVEEIEIIGELYVDPIATDIVLTTSVNNIASDETVTFEACVYDQFGSLMDVTATVLDTDGNVIEENTFTPEGSGSYTFYAQYKGLTSETVTVNVVADHTSKITPIHTVTMGDEVKEDVNVFNNEVHPELNQHLIISFTENNGGYDFDLIKLRWEAACPSDYTVTATYTDGTQAVVYTEEGRGFVNLYNPVDRIYATAPADSGENAPMRAATIPENTSLKNVSALTILPTAKDHNYPLRLLGVDAYGKEGTVSALTDIMAEAYADTTVSVYNVAGVMIRANVNAAEALDNLPAGIYIVNGKKYVRL